MLLQNLIIQGRFCGMGASLKSFPLYRYSNATSVSQPSFIYPFSSSLKIRFSALAHKVIHFCLLPGSAATKPDRETSPSEYMWKNGWLEQGSHAGKKAGGATHLWKWCQRCPSADCSCVSACEEGCMYHSSVHSPMDWWAACKSRRRSGWVPGAMGAKDKRALSISRGKHHVTLLWMDVPALRSSVHKQKWASQHTPPPKILTASLAKHTRCAPGEPATHPTSAGRCQWFSCQISRSDIAWPSHHGGHVGRTFQSGSHMPGPCPGARRWIRGLLLSQGSPPISAFWSFVICAKPAAENGATGLQRHKIAT